MSKEKPNTIKPGSLICCASSLAYALIYVALKNYVSAENYFLCSLTKIKGVFVGVGVFGKVWIFTDKL